MNSLLSDRKDCPSSLVLERIATGELDETSHLSSCASCGRELASIRQSNASLRADPHFAATRRRILTASVEKPRHFWRWTPALIAPFAAALLLFGVMRPSPDTFTVKGGGLSMIVERDGAVRPWDGGPFRPEDRVQLIWSSPQSGFLAVVGRSHRGEVEVLFPRTDPDAAPVSVSATPMPVGPGFRIPPEEAPYDVLAVFSPNPFEVGALAARVAQGAEIDDSAVTVSRLRLEVEPGQ